MAGYLYPTGIASGYSGMASYIASRIGSVTGFSGTSAPPAPTGNDGFLQALSDGIIGSLYPILAIGADVASVGGGAQSTTIASITPASNGLYRICIAISCTTGDTVSVAVVFTDAVNGTFQVITPINGVSLGANTTTYAVVIARANSSSLLLAKITGSSQTTTKASATIERLF